MSHVVATPLTWVFTRSIPDEMRQLIRYHNTDLDKSRQFALFVICVDSAWVLGSILLLLTNWLPLSVEGKWTVGLVAVIVDMFATLQFLEWRKM